jgi:hypothetical protein
VRVVVVNVNVNVNAVSMLKQSTINPTEDVISSALNYEASLADNHPDAIE